MARHQRILGLAALLLVLAALPFFMSSYHTFQLTMVLVYAIVLLGLNILTGFNGQISLGHGAFFAIGAYTAAVLIAKVDMPYWETVPIAGVICLVVGFSGDIKQAQKRAAEAKSGVAVGCVIPKEGAQLWFDNLAIPKDAPDPAEAHALINYLLRADIAAKNTNFISYANGNLASQAFIDKSILDDRTVYPDGATMAKLYTITAHDQRTQRLINRLWTRVKTGR